MLPFSNSKIVVECGYWVLLYLEKSSTTYVYHVMAKRLLRLKVEKSHSTLKLFFCRVVYQDLAAARVSTKF